MCYQVDGFEDHIVHINISEKIKKKEENVVKIAENCVNVMC